MIKFSKAQLSSLIATALDFLITLLLGKLLLVGYLEASLLGTICGGVFHFYLSRNYVFGAGNYSIRTQAFRYLVIWAGNLVLNITGVYAFTHFLMINYLLSKTIVAVLLGCSYNYIFQSSFVFK
jgi:putative flippase GtrA